MSMSHGYLENEWNDLKNVVTYVCTPNISACVQQKNNIIFYRQYM